jgi:hypothetical protein
MAERGFAWQGKKKEHMDERIGAMMKCQYL